MTQAIDHQEAQARHHDYVLPNGTKIALETYLGKNLVSLANEGGQAPAIPDPAAIYPMAYLVQQSPDSEIQPHYHQADQFQLFLGGSGRIGTHSLAGMTIHYAGSLSPYGPIVSGAGGLQYLTFRNRWDPGAQWMPENAQRLRAHADRKHFALSRDIPALAESMDGETHWQRVMEEALPGLGAWLVRASAGAAVVGPDPDVGAGQFWFTLEGDIAHEERLLGPRSVVFVEPNEQPLQLRVGGDRGATLLVMQFPRKR